MSAAHRTVATLSFGTYTVHGTTCRDAVLHAVAAGHRCIDTAAIYRNEEEVGEAIRRCGMPREQLHITTKLAPQEQHGFEAALAALQGSLKRLGLAYVDCYLMHWPGTGKLKPADKRNISLRCETYRGMCEAKKRGLTKEVGVCNFIVRHFESLTASGLPLPEVHQLELHPLCRQTEVVAWCKKQGISIEAYSPLAQGEERVFTHKGLLAAVAKHPGATVADALLYWSFQQGYTPIVRSTKAEHIQANAAAWKRYVAWKNSSTKDAAKADEPGDDLQAIPQLIAAADAMMKADGKDLHVCWDGNVVA
jgi:diketogulonate reductase-like aldo/keto reductase